WNQVDYRLGFRYNRTPVSFRHQQINDMAVTVGFGFPLPETNFGATFSQFNISAEFGQQGTLSNSLVRERYININIGFTINDTWYGRRSLDEKYARLHPKKISTNIPSTFHGTRDVLAFLL